MYIHFISSNKRLDFAFVRALSFHNASTVLWFAFINGHSVMCFWFLFILFFYRELLVLQLRSLRFANWISLVYLHKAAIGAVSNGQCIDLLQFRCWTLTLICPYLKTLERNQEAEIYLSVLDSKSNPISCFSFENRIKIAVVQSWKVKLRGTSFHE